jgi:hypothetical protein
MTLKCCGVIDIKKYATFIKVFIFKSLKQHTSLSKSVFSFLRFDVPTAVKVTRVLEKRIVSVFISTQMIDIFSRLFNGN